MKITAEPRSDQWNSDDFIGGPRTFTIARVVEGKAEQKYDVELVEGEGRVWRPPPTVVRLLIAAWGDEGKDWAGKRVTLYRDDTVRFGPEVVGGIRVSHMSHLPTGDKPFTTKLTVSRGKKGRFTVEPLPDAPQASPEPTAEQVAASTDTNELRDMWQRSGPERRTQIQARVAELNAQPAEPQQPATDDGAWEQTGPDLLDTAQEEPQ